jgi:uncharacterized protein
VISLQKIQRYCDAIARLVRPKKIILFGSYAYGKPTEDSDIDVMVVMPRRRRADLRTAVKIRLGIDTDFPVDILVRGESDIERRLRDRDMFIVQLMKEGRVMYEAVNA